MPKLNINAGTVFGKLTVIKEGQRIKLPSGQYNRTLNCKCLCGQVKDVRVVHLTRGRTLSCGCLGTKSGKPRHNKSSTPIYNIWRGILNRTKSYHSERHLYFDKGIKMDENWENDFEVFEKWCIDNNYKKGLQIDRKENSKGYFPENCRFVTPSVNVNNRDNTFKVLYNGQEIPFMDAVRLADKESRSDVIRSRIKRGWNHQKAIDTPIREGNYCKKN